MATIDDIQLLLVISTVFHGEGHGWRDSFNSLVRVRVSEGGRPEGVDTVKEMESVPHVLRSAPWGFAGLRWGNPSDGKNLTLFSPDFRVLRTLSVGTDASGLSILGDSLVVSYSEEGVHSGGQVLRMFNHRGEPAVDPRVQAVTSFDEVGNYKIEDITQFLIDQAGFLWVFTDSSGSEEWLVFDANGRFSESLAGCARDSSAVRGFVHGEMVFLPRPDFTGALVVHSPSGKGRLVSVQNSARLRAADLVDFAAVGRDIYLIQYPSAELWRLSSVWEKEHRDQTD